MLLIKANSELKNIFQRLIKTMQMPVTWNNVFVINNNFLILAGDVRSLIFNFDNKKVYTTILEIPEESLQLESVPSDTLLNNAMNITLYAFGKWGTIGALKVDKNYQTLNTLFAQIFRPIGVEPEFGPDNFRFFKGGMQITYEDAMIAVLRLLKNEGKLNEQQSLVTSEIKNNSKNSLQKDSSNDENGNKESGYEEFSNNRNSEDNNTSNRSADYEDDYENDYEIGLWHNLCWKTENYAFSKAPASENDAAKSRIGNNFYITNYLCPKCGEKMYLGIYPVDRELLIDTEEGRVFMARTYACHNCNTLYTPRPKKLLQEGDIYILKFDEDRTAYEDYLDILGSRAARTTNYKFNEFESERNTAAKEASEGISAGSVNPDIDNNAYAHPSKLKNLKDKFSKGSGKFFTKKSKVSDAKTSPDNITPADSKTYSGKIPPDAAGSDNKSIYSNNIKANRNSTKPFNTDSKKASADSTASSTTDYKKVSADSTVSSTTDYKKVSADSTAPSTTDYKKTNANSTNTDITGTKGSAAGIPAGSMPMDSAQSAALLSKKTTDELKIILSDLERKNEAKPSTPDTAPESHYAEAVKAALREKLTAKYDARMGALNNLAPRQLNDLKNQINKETVLSADTKSEYIKQIDSRLYQAETKALAQKVEISRKKSYAEIEQIINDVENRDIPEDLKQDTLTQLKQIKSYRAKREAEYLITHMPLHMDRKQLSLYLDKLNQYKEVDLTPYRAQLDAKMDMAEKEEMSAMIKRGGKKDRTALWNLYEELKERDYKEENKAPFLEKIYEKIRHMDEDAIERICPSIVTLSFADGIKAYEEISQGMFLPELKTDTLEMIKRRLTKLKTDESVQLMRKLKNDMDEKMTDYEDFYFYNAREERKAPSGEQNITDEEPEHAAMMRAINGYASSRDEYEYPLMVCDTSRSKNGREGFVLTPDHIFYHTFLNSGIISITNISSIHYIKRLFTKGIFVKQNNAQKQKLPNNVKPEELEIFAKVLNDFTNYLQEKPESRNLEYMAKDKHDVIHCYRCGYVYKGGSVCPKCGSKMNK